MADVHDIARSTAPGTDIGYDKPTAGRLCGGIHEMITSLERQKGSQLDGMETPTLSRLVSYVELFLPLVKTIHSDTGGGAPLLLGMLSCYSGIAHDGEDDLRLAITNFDAVPQEGILYTHAVRLRGRAYAHLGTLVENGQDAVDCFESAIEDLTLARERDFAFSRRATIDDQYWLGNAQAQYGIRLLRYSDAVVASLERRMPGPTHNLVAAGWDNLWEAANRFPQEYSYQYARTLEQHADSFPSDSPSAASSIARAREALKAVDGVDSKKLRELWERLDARYTMLLVSRSPQKKT